MKTIKQVFTVLTVTLFLFFSNNINAQKTKLTKEEIRLTLAEGMVSFVGGINDIILSRPELFFDENCKNCLPQDITYNKLIKGLGVKAERITREGNDLLYAAFLFIQNSTTENDILNNYNGKEVLNALNYIIDNDKKNSNSNAELNLFGAKSKDDLIQVASSDKRDSGCCWFCFRCKLFYYFFNL